CRCTRGSTGCTTVSSAISAPEPCRFGRGGRCGADTVSDLASDGVSDQSCGIVSTTTRIRAPTTTPAHIHALSDAWEPVTRVTGPGMATWAGRIATRTRGTSVGAGASVCGRYRGVRGSTGAAIDSFSA